MKRKIFIQQVIQVSNVRWASEHLNIGVQKKNRVFQFRQYQSEKERKEYNVKI